MNSTRRVTLCGCLATVLVAFGSGCSRPASSPSTSSVAADQVSQLQTKDLVAGQGPEATNGARVAVHYTGWLYDHSAPDHKGKEFDSSRTAGQPFSFDLGKGQVIAGWDQGVLGMK